MITTGFEQKRARIEMLPLIDVVFLLLVFFIYAMMSMVTHKGIQVNLPFASTATQNRDDFLSLVITSDNNIYRDQTLLTLEQVRTSVKKDQTVFIRADQDADVGVAVSVLDALRAAGVTDVSFETKEASF